MPVSKLKIQASHVQFSIGFSVALYVVCNALIFDQLAKWFRDSDGIDYSALTAYLVAGLCLSIGFFSLFAHRLTIKPAAILLTICSAVATYFIAKYGVAIDSSMVRNAIYTDSTEVGQLLSAQMLPYFALLIVVPVLIIWRTEIRFGAPVRDFFHSLRLTALAFAVALTSIFLEYNAIFRVGNVSNKYIVYSLVPINVISSSISVLSKAVKPYFETRQTEIKFAAQVQSPGNLVVVLAVGEASRRKNFSLYGYSRRQTNPVLQNIDGLHLLNAIATRGSTLYALPKILEKNNIKLTTVVSKVGIPTFCFVNYTLYDNCAAVGETKVRECAHDGKCYDEDVVPLLKDNLSTYRSGYRFVVLHLGGGSHGPAYGDRHPPEFLKFQPTCNDADVANKCSIEELYNSYDNTILYVDHVLGQTIGTLEGSGVPYVLIYLPDHGESLMEGGFMFHGVPPGMKLPAEQAQIPLIVKSSIPISIDPRPEYQQPDVFDSVLDLFSIQAPLFDKAGSFIKKTPAD